MERQSRMPSSLRARRFLVALSFFVAVGLAYGKECNNVPTERVSHTLRAREIARGTLLDEVSGVESQLHNGEGSRGVLAMPKSALIGTFRKFLSGWNGRDQVEKPLPTGKDFAEELDVLVEFDDWGQAWTTIAKPMFERNRRVFGGRNEDVPALHSRAADDSDGDHVERRSLMSAGNRTSVLKDVSLHKVWSMRESVSSIAVGVLIFLKLMSLYSNWCWWNFDVKGFDV